MRICGRVVKGPGQAHRRPRNQRPPVQEPMLKGQAGLRPRTMQNAPNTPPNPEEEYQISKDKGLLP